MRLSSALLRLNATWLAIIFYLTTVFGSLVSDEIQNVEKAPKVVDPMIESENDNREQLSQPLLKENLRRNLQVRGSNCILIERGIIPPYYDCVGCVTSLAIACLDDMRHNRTGAVASGCELSAASENYRYNCCPQVSLNKNNVYDLMYPGSAYPQALACIKSVGCESSTVYTQLLSECKSTCPVTDPRVSGQSVCLATFNAAFSSKKLMKNGLWVLSPIVCGLAMLFIWS